MRIAVTIAVTVGSLLWAPSVVASQPERSVSLRLTWSAETGSATETPVVAGDTVYAASRAGGLSAFDAATGHLVWKGETGSLAVASSVGYQGELLEYTRPSVAGNGVVYVLGSSPKRLYGFSVSCGSEGSSCQPIATVDLPGWRFTIGHTRSPIVSGDGFIYTEGGGQVPMLAFRADCTGTCTPVWSAHAGAPAVADGIVFATADGRLEALDGATGREVWSGGRSAKCCGQNPGPVVDNGVVYAVLGGRFWAFPTTCGTSPSTCRALWWAEVPDVFSAFVVSDGVMYVGTETSGGSGVGHVYAFANCGTSGERCRATWVGDAGGELSNGELLVDGSRIFALSAEQATLDAFPTTCEGDCQPLWRTGSLTSKPGVHRVGGLVVQDGLVFLVDNEGMLEAFPEDCASGGGICKPAWSWRSESGVLTDPAVAGGMIFVGSSTGVVSAFEPAEQAQRSKNSSSLLTVWAVGATILLLLGAVLLERRRRSA